MDVHEEIDEFLSVKVKVIEKMTNGNNGSDMHAKDVSGFKGNTGKNTETPIIGGSSGSNQGSKFENTETLRSNMPPVTPIHFVVPEKFTGMNFKRWQEKMFFYLTISGLANFVKDDPPTTVVDDLPIAKEVHAWEHYNSVCRAHILENLNDAFHNVYQFKETAKELWESLNQRYGAGDVVAKRSLVKHFMNYTMVDSKTVTSQVHDLCLVVLELRALDMVLSESFLVAAIIDKLPPAWDDFKSYLNLKGKDMRVKELFDRLKGQEAYREYLRDFSKKGQRNVDLGPRGGVSKRRKVVRENNIGAYEIEDIIQDLSEMKI